MDGAYHVLLRTTGRVLQAGFKQRKYYTVLEIVTVLVKLTMNFRECGNPRDTLLFTVYRISFS